MKNTDFDFFFLVNVLAKQHIKAKGRLVNRNLRKLS